MYVIKFLASKIREASLKDVKVSFDVVSYLYYASLEASTSLILLQHLSDLEQRHSPCKW